MEEYCVLCTVDLSLCPHALDPLRAVAEVDHAVLDRAATLERIGEYDAYFGHTNIQIDREFLDRAERLKVIGAPSTGTDHIATDLLEERGIKLLALTREYDLLDTFTATAECAWAVLLSCVRQIPWAFDASRAGDWWTSERFIGRQLSGKTLGIIGVGRLGRMMVPYGKAFRMRVLGADPIPLDIDGVEQVPLDTLLRESDVISLHVHLRPHTSGLLSREAFAKMKDGVIIINTSRGGLIDEAAFLDALRSGKVSAAGLDVIDSEWMENMSEHSLIQYARSHDNVVITPHIGGATVESVAGARLFMGRKLADYLRNLSDQPTRVSQEEAVSGKL